MPSERAPKQLFVLSTDREGHDPERQGENGLIFKDGTS
jgi:hypothetical protein